MSTWMVPRHGLFILFAILSLVMFRAPLSSLASFSFRHEHCSHGILIPAISAWLIYLGRRKIFSDVEYRLGPAMALILVGILLHWLGEKHRLQLTQNDYLSLTTFSVIVIWIGGFILCYGPRAFRSASFPLLLLILMAPMPGFLLEKSIFALQKGTAEAAAVLFSLTGVSVFREGFVFYLPGINIEVAKECSGIRSSLALFDASLLAGYLFLRSGWRKIVLSMSIFPIVIFKNALRIVIICLSALYVDRSFLTGRLHHYGGIPFFLLALAIVAPIVRLLQKSEDKTQNSTHPRMQEHLIGG